MRPRCLFAGYIVLRIGTSLAMSLRGTFLFLLRYRSVALYSGASYNEPVLAQPIEVGYDIGLWVRSHSCPYNHCLLNVAIRSCFAEEQSRESELQSGGVAIDHLSGNVQEDAVLFFVHVL